MLAGMLIAAPVADAEPYPMCSPTVDPDCYFLSAFHSEFPGVTNSDADLIAGAKEACSWMRRDNSPTAFMDWVKAHSRENPQYNAPGHEVSGFALSFAGFAASAYCPDMLNPSNPAHW